MLSNSFKWKHYEGEIILLNVRWYLKYSVSYGNLEEMMAERGVEVDHTKIIRWVHQYSPESEKKVRKYLKPNNDSWRVDETYVKVKGKAPSQNNLCILIGRCDFHYQGRQSKLQ